MWKVKHGGRVVAHHWTNEVGWPCWLTWGQDLLNLHRSHLKGQPFPPNITHCWWKHNLRTGGEIGAEVLGCIARVDKTQFEKAVVGNDYFWPPSCHTARALYCAVCWGDAILQPFLQRDLLDVQLIVYIVDCKHQGLKMECCLEQDLGEYFIHSWAWVTCCNAWPTDLGLGQYCGSSEEWPL